MHLHSKFRWEQGFLPPLLRPEIVEWQLNTWFDAKFHFQGQQMSL